MSPTQAQPSAVESAILQKQGNPPLQYPGEHVPVLVADSFPLLGKLTALRFLEWVQAHPEGVISLPTGKTPEYFIKHVQHFLDTWDHPATQKELGDCGLATGNKPDMRGLHFVQMDDFYPMNPLHQNSFHYFVRQYYLNGLGMDPGKALLIDLSRTGIPAGYNLSSIWPDGRVDLSLRTKQAGGKLQTLQKKVLAAIDAYATEYENAIRSLGGIGFFLGGIGPDGHIAFNVSGSDFFSTTRLCPLNYETAAAAAGDLGGIEISRYRLAFTIGLATITQRPDVTAIIFAAGEAKAGVATRAIEGGPQLACPASILSSVPGARFYLTQGAAGRLTDRRLAALKAQNTIDTREATRILVDMAAKNGKRITALTEQDLRQQPEGAILLDKAAVPLEDLKNQQIRLLEDRISRGRALPSNQVFLHTAPHHDDIMLGYMPAIMHLVRDPSNHHHFTYLTSGFTAVTNHYLLAELRKLKSLLEKRVFHDLAAEGYFDPGNPAGRVRDAYLCLNAIAARDPDGITEAGARRLLRALVEVFEEKDLQAILDRINEMVNYLKTQYPGKKDFSHIQRIKGMLREWEGDLIWGYVGIRPSRIHHMRLGFYKGDIFTESPERDRDMKPILDLLNTIKPTVVTVALDPEASGPDTHYKVLQAVAGALKEYITTHAPPLVWGYRNVWYRFAPEEATHYIPTTLNTMAVMENAFMNCFGSQKEASFPSYEHDGPFCHLAQKIWIEQFERIKTCLGEAYFRESDIPQLRAVRGFVFLRELTCEGFFDFVDQARHFAENR